MDFGGPRPPCQGQLLTFEGGASAQFCACAPPDSDGDVGPNHYVEAINTAFAVFNKNGTMLAGPITYNTLFAPLVGTPCQNQNHGDPFVLYDQIGLPESRRHGIVVDVQYGLYRRALHPANGCSLVSIRCDWRHASRHSCSTANLD